jgi:hypothetical protein
LIALSEATLAVRSGTGFDVPGPWRSPLGGTARPYRCTARPTVAFAIHHTWNEYLPGEENEQLRQSFVSRLDDIEKAREAVHGDIDAVVEGPASAGADAVDDLVETVPTTMAGLLSFLLHLAKARRRDPEMFCEQHLEPLIDGLGRAAAR